MRRENQASKIEEKCYFIMILLVAAACKNDDYTIFGMRKTIN